MKQEVTVSGSLQMSIFISMALFKHVIAKTLILKSFIQGRQMAGIKICQKYLSETLSHGAT